LQQVNPSSNCISWGMNSESWSLKHIDLLRMQRNSCKICNSVYNMSGLNILCILKADVNIKYCTDSKLNWMVGIFFQSKY
jgi:hypothetical protein